METAKLHCNPAVFMRGEWQPITHLTHCVHTERIMEYNALFEKDFWKVITCRFNSELVLQVWAAGHYVGQGGSVREVHSVLVLL